MGLRNEAGRMTEIEIGKSDWKHLNRGAWNREVGKTGND